MTTEPTTIVANSKGEISEERTATVLKGKAIVPQNLVHNHGYKDTETKATEIVKGEGNP